MEKQFREKANYISSRAVAVSAYLFAEGLYIRKKARLMRDFVKFFTHYLMRLEGI